MKEKLVVIGSGELGKTIAHQLVEHDDVLLVVGDSNNIGLTQDPQLVSNVYKYEMMKPLPLLPSVNQFETLPTIYTKGNKTKAQKSRRAKSNRAKKARKKNRK